MIFPEFSNLVCASCGRVMGRKPGVQVIPGLICDDRVCSYQGEAPLNIRRDSFIVAAALDGTPASWIALTNGMSRQRVYQIVDAWKQGRAA